jgi:tetratricopeptide (TPR) repeat protein
MLGLLAFALAAAPQQSGPAQPAPTTLQDKFDRATQDATAGRCDQAIAMFRSIEKDPRVHPGSVPAAAIALRKGICLANIDAHDEAEAAITVGLPILDKAGPAYATDVANGWQALGELAYNRYDYAAATRDFRTALDRLKGTDRLSVLVSLAKSTAFDGTPEALSYAQEAIALLSAKPKDLDPKAIGEMLASFYTLHARTLLLSGGLTLKVSLNEVSMRSDLAMAAMLAGKKDEAQRYLAYTGAGRIKESPFARAVSMEPPLCGSETGLRPEDVAVVEFALSTSGEVGAAQVVYSRGGPQVAAAFGTAVREWRWTPEAVAKVPPFYRITRVELRCSNALGSGPGTAGPMRERFLGWAQAALAEAGRADRSYNALQALAADTTAAVDARVAALAILADDAPMSMERRTAAIVQAIALANNRVPVPVRDWLQLVRLATEPGSRAGANEQRWSEHTRGAYLTLAAQPEFANDALAMDTALLLGTERSGPLTRADAEQRLTRVAEDSRLDEHHPLRQLAWLELADRSAAAKDFAKAQTYFAKSGLSQEQCSLLGVTPALRRSGASSTDYPQDAIRMGFEGWVNLEFDITPDGHALNARALTAYPPLVFVDAGLRMSRDFLYETSYRPGANTACSANQTTISFILPR